MVHESFVGYLASVEIDTYCKLWLKSFHHVLEATASAASSLKESLAFHRINLAKVISHVFVELQSVSVNLIPGMTLQEDAICYVPI